MPQDAGRILRELLDHRQTARSLALKAANLRGLRLAGLRADALDLEEADLREASLTDVRWKACILRDARLDSANLTGAVLRICDLDQARAINATLVRTRLENSTARGARFDGADLTEAVLTDTDFSRASFREANLEGVSASGADFRGADLRGARLRNADLVDCDFRGADLTEADLEGADLHGADFRGAVGDHAALPSEDESAWSELPAEIRPLAETMTPIVHELLRSAGERGAIDAETAERLMEEAAKYQSESTHQAPNPDTLDAVSRVLDQLGDNILPALIGALQQPNDAAPPPEVQEMILRLREAFSLDETSSAEDVLSRLVSGMGRPPD